MFRRLGLVCAALAFFSIAGGPWGVLQTVAWAKMLRDYHRQSGSVAVAVQQSFDGKHPCELCREILSAKAREHRDIPAAPGLKDAAKIKARLAEPAFRPAALVAAEMLLPRTRVPRVCERNEPPPVPPPRHAVLAA